MKIAFFNYLELEKGGGTSKFFLDVSGGLKLRYPDLDISIITLDEALNKRINRIYSIYFQKNIEKDLTHHKRISLNKSVNYLKAASIGELRTLLRKFDVVYSKNDFVEAFILKILVGRKYLKKLIFGFHTPIYYEKIFNLQSYFHNLLYSSFLYRFLLKDANKFHVLNTSTETTLKKWFKDKVILKIYNPTV